MMHDWTAADLTGMELCIHGERLKFCLVCSLMRNIAISLCSAAFAFKQPKRMKTKNFKPRKDKI